MDLIRDQRQFPARRGTFGPLGNIRDNGCGAIAVYNVLAILGTAVPCENIIQQFCRSWVWSTVLGGVLGSNPFYVMRCLKRAGFHTAFCSRRRAGNHDAYIAVYLWANRREGLGAHFQALQRKEAGVLEAWNPCGVYTDFDDFFRRSGAVGAFVIGVNRQYP